MRYRRSRASGGTFFFTVVTYERRNTLCLPENIILLENVFSEVKAKHPFEMDAFIILPDHVHCIWTLPPDDNDFSMRWMLIKSNFSRMCKEVKGPANKNRLNKRKRSVWQRRFWEHEIRDERDLKAHIEYIHYNPVKHGLAKSPADWAYSSFHRYVRSGIYEKGWGADCEMSFEKSVGGE